MDNIMKVISKMIKWMVKEKYSIKMGKYILVK
jgi:hypothetical protein